MPYRQTRVAGLPALSLFNDALELVAIPSAGARITHLRLRRRGREWLWRNPTLPFAVPRPDPGPSPTAYVDRHDSGGWDECFPTVGACPRPGASAGTPWLPDHGELWHAPWQHDVFADRGVTTWRSTTECRTVPAEFTRRVEVAEADGHAGVVSLHYQVRSTGREPFAFLWSAHPLLSAQPGTTVELPGVELVRVDAATGRHDLRPDAEFAWPLDGAARFTMPAAAGWAAKLFARSPAEGRAIVTDPLRGETLELQWDAAEIPWVGLWLNPGGFGPGGTPYYNLAVEPCLAAPDRLDRAVDEWQVAPILHPGEERTWRLTVVLREAVS